MVRGYADPTDWRSLRWAMREMVDYWAHLGWTRSQLDVVQLWFNREAYVRKYHPELIDE